MWHVPGLKGLLGYPLIHLLAYGVMTVLAVKALSNVTAVLQMRRRFRSDVLAFESRRARLSSNIGLNVNTAPVISVTDPELAEAVKNARSSGSLVPIDVALRRNFDPVMDRSERGLFYCPSFGLIFTVIGGLLAILSSVGSGQFDRNAMIEGIGIAMATTAAGFIIALVEYWCFKTAERLRDFLLAELVEQVTLLPRLAEGVVS